MESPTLQTRLGPVAWRSSGDGPPLVFFAGALANGDLWRDVVVALEDRYRCITIDLPLGAHTLPLAPGADRSAMSLARLLLDCLELLDVDDATVVANDTAGGLMLLALGTDHPALGRVGRLVLTNCESYEKFPPDELKRAAALSRRFPRVARGMLRLQARVPAARRKLMAGLAASGVDEARAASFLDPARDDKRVADDLVALLADERPEMLLEAAKAIPHFDRPVRLVWGDSCDFFPPEDGRRLAADFPSARLVQARGAKTWVPIDAPEAVAEAITDMVPTPVA
jgi:pimeloyl-ACP methyl ester carboxylesterase